MSRQSQLSTLWVFLFLNYIFCDVFSLMYPPMIQEMATTGLVFGIDLTQEFLLFFAVVMEAGMVMVLVSRFAPRRANRIANFMVASALILVQTGSLAAGENTLHYWFFSIIEIATLAAILTFAWGWRGEGHAAQV